MLKAIAFCTISCMYTVLLVFHTYARTYHMEAYNDHYYTQDVDKDKIHVINLMQKLRRNPTT